MEKSTLRYLGAGPRSAGCMGNPRSATDTAGAATVAKLHVPKRSRTDSNASGAAHGPADNTPLHGIRAMPCSRNHSIVAARGATVFPLIEKTFRSAALYTRADNSPPNVCMCGFTTPSTSVAATAASNALPPLRNTDMPASADR